MAETLGRRFLGKSGSAGQDLEASFEKNRENWRCSEKTCDIAKNVLVNLRGTVLPKEYIVPAAAVKNLSAAPPGQTPAKQPAAGGGASPPAAPRRLTVAAGGLSAAAP